MSVTRWFIVLAIALLAAPAAHAADGAACKTDTHYTPGSSPCIILADGRVETGTVANSVPFDTQPATAGKPMKTAFAYGRCPTSCEPGTATLCESDSAVIGAPNVCHVLGSITGCGAAFISEVTTKRVTKRWVWVEFAADITDTNCNGAGGVDATITFLP